MQKNDSEQESTAITLDKLMVWHEQLNQQLETNIDLRIKYPTQPMRFYQSEQEIHTILEKLSEVTQAHIPMLFESRIMHPIIRVLTHPNTDINIQCIEFMHDLICEEISEDEAFTFMFRMIVAMVDNGLLEGLLDSLHKLDEEKSVEQYQIALQILKLLETIIQTHEQSQQVLIRETKLLEYLANRIMPNYRVSHKLIDDNKYVSSDLLITLLTYSQLAQQMFHRMHGMEVLLETIKLYVQIMPKHVDEQEFLSNLLDCVNVLLINNTAELKMAKQVYHSMHGNHIMLCFVKAKNQYSSLALKAIANAFTGDDDEEIVDRFVDMGGLKYIFAILLRKGLKSGDVDEQKIIYENCLNVIYALMRGANGITKIRVERKLAQDRCQKMEKIFELRTEYVRDMKDEEKELTEEQYLNSVKEGQNIVEIIDKLLLLFIYCKSLRKRFVALMSLYNVDIESIQATIHQQYQFMADGAQKNRVEVMLSKNIGYLRTLCEHVPAEKEVSEEENR